MKCQVCEKAIASVGVKQVVNGVMSELHVCESCARGQGVDMQLPLPELSDFLFGNVAAAMAEGRENDMSCPACHMHQTDFHKGSLLGCPECYDVFNEDVMELLEGMHKDTRHFGKIPRQRKRAQLDALQRAIEKATQEHNGELADRLKARERELRGTSPRAAKGRDGSRESATPKSQET